MFHCLKKKEKGGYRKPICFMQEGLICYYCVLPVQKREKARWGGGERGRENGQMRSDVNWAEITLEAETSQRSPNC